MAHQITLTVSAAVLQTLKEYAAGPSLAVDEAVTHWVSCACTANIRAGKLEVCEFCKQREVLSRACPDQFDQTPRPT